MKKIDFCTFDFAEAFKSALNYSMKPQVFLKAKAIIDDPRVIVDYDFANAVFSICTDPVEAILCMFYYDQLNGEETDLISLANRIDNKYRGFAFNRDNPFGWVDRNSFKPDLESHKALSIDMITGMASSSEGVSLVTALEALKFLPETHRNWETAAMIILGWKDIERQLRGEQCGCPACTLKKELEETATKLSLN